MADLAAPAAWRNIGATERLVSGLGGAALLGYGLARRPSPASVLYAVAGALLLQRGLTGHSALYHALGISPRAAPEAPRWPEPATVLILDEIDRASDGSFPASDPPSWNPSFVGCPARTYEADSAGVPGR
jgi:hypothetical protein